MQPGADDAGPRAGRTGRRKEGSMKAFEYVNPANVSGAVKELTKAGSHAKIMAGGIDLLGELKDYIRTPDVVVNLKSIPGLNKWSSEPNGLRIGALVTLAELEQNPLIR